MVGGSRTAPLGKQMTPPFLFHSPPPAITESSLTQLFAEMQRSMARQEEAVKKIREDVLELRSQNISQSSSVTNLADTSTLRIGSSLDFSKLGSNTVEVMSVTVDQPMDHTTNPRPSSPSDHIELGCSSDEHLLAADSDEETEATQDDDHLLSESEDDEKKLPEEPLKTSWSEDE